MTTVADTLQQAVQYHQAARLSEAERLYHDVLAATPTNIDALHLLGLLELQSGRLEAGSQRIAAAIATLEQAGLAPAPSHAALHLNLGNAYQAAGQLERAVASYRRALELDPACAPGYSNLGNVLQAQGDLASAVANYQTALRHNPDYPEAYFNLGNAYEGLGQLDLAIASFRAALRLRPDDPQAHNNLAHALQSAGQLGDAVAAYETAVRIAPGSASIRINLGSALRGLGRLDEAIAQYQHALALEPTSAVAHYNLANARLAQGDRAAAASGYARAVALKPDYAPAHYNLATLHKDLGDTAAAVASYRRALESDPNLVGALFNLANLLQDQGELDAAAAIWRRLLALEPDHAEAQAGFGNALHALGLIDEAITAFRRALALKPDLAEAQFNLANTLQDADRITEALKHFARAVEIKPDYVEAHWNRSLALLATGDLATGWPEYEWRWQRSYSQHLIRRFTQPQWRGEPLDGKRILLHAEQGLGDTLQFCRYARLVAARRPAGLVLEVPSPLVGLLTDSFADLDIEIVPMASDFPGGEGLPRFDVHCPLMSLPLAFGTRLDTIPSDLPYLRVDRDKALRWQGLVGGAPRPRVGLVWAGGIRANHAEAVATDRRRSLALAQLAPLGTVPGITFYSLQKGGPAAQAKEPPAGLVPIDLMDAVETFADTAALAAQLDLVISVDTSVAHLVAGLGKPVWLLSRFDGCWRWLLDRDDSPWYPTVRLYRQTAPGDWSPALERLRNDLAAWAGDFRRL
jgi:tetratricopeptide (TPR) repeat protein